VVGLIGLLMLVSSCDTTRQARLECIAPADPGGGWDLTCRTVARALRDLDLAPEIMRVRNMPGAGGGVAYANIVSQQPDNSGIIVAASPTTTLALAQGQYGDLTEEDVRWVGAVGADASVVAVASNAPWQNLSQLLESWRTDPGSVVVGGGAAGGQDHIKAIALARAAGISARDVRYVPFDGGGAAVTSLLGGFVQLFTGEASEILGQLEAGNLRVLAVLSPEREPGMLANTPTAREQGYDVEWVVWRGFYAPPGIPDEDYNRWVTLLATLTESEEWPELLARDGLSPFTSLGAEFEGLVRRQTTEYRELSRELGLLQ
jgi:putative tricarboxylic transport membrane protein